MDLCLYARNEGIPVSALAEALGLSADDVERIFKDIEAKRRVATILLAPTIVL
jgi:NAD+ synthase